MNKIGKRKNHAFHTAAVLPTALLSIGLTIPTHTAHAAAAVDPTEIIVTARREKEELQKVPISMTVFDQETLSDRNVTNGADLVAYTPSLNVNQRFGSDQASFAIRGFSQDLRTTASVAVYFADVVAPRSSGSITAGDGAGPGSFFDLQNVQVLKGPQGTLFGRNTTGGAIQLVPQQPTDKLEGYLELSGGNYDMRRVQGVFNLPVTDIARARFGVDSMDREGYIKNESGVGPERLSDVHYIAGRASLLLDLSDSVQNYFITQYTHSENKGSIQRIVGCNSKISVGFATKCYEALAVQGDDFYTALSADHPDPKASLKQWQFINTTTWDLNDNFRVTNILGYADLLQNMRGSIFGSQFFLSGQTPSGGPMQLMNFPAGQAPGIPSNSQTTFSEELRFSGKAFDEKLHWQTGLYYEESRPDGWSGSQSAGMLICDQSSSYEAADPASFLCYDQVGLSSYDPITQLTKFQGSIERSIGKMFYKNQAIYAQGTYELTEKLKTTLGLRYTVDDTEGESKRITYLFPQDIMNPVFSAPITVKCSVASASFDNGCLYRVKDRSEAPTWTVGLEYFPIDDVMAYAKYTRGYRQGSVVLPAPGGFDKYDPEQVDAYELGAKTSFQSLISGTFNISLFYNKLKNQQLQLGLTPQAGGSATTTIQNANASTIQGVEAETTLRLLDGLTYSLSYTYLDTHLDSMDPPLVIPGWASIPSAIEGQHLTFSPRHAVTTGLNYRFPLPLEVGDISAGITYTFTSSQNSTNSHYKYFEAGIPGPVGDIEVKGSPYGELPARQLLNMNLGWKAIFGSPFDASLFVTNALKEEYNAYVSGLINSSGAEFGVAGEPRMYGAKIKYSFGL